MSIEYVRVDAHLLDDGHHMRAPVAVRFELLACDLDDLRADPTGLYLGKIHVISARLLQFDLQRLFDIRQRVTPALQLRDLPKEHHVLFTEQRATGRRSLGLG
jgi:hypothetical protein